MFATITMTVAEALAIQEKQVTHWLTCLPTQGQRDHFCAAVKTLNESKNPASWREVPRGAKIEELYFLSQGWTLADHATHCASMD
jgi:hypothetical protein